MADQEPNGFHRHESWTLPLDGARRAAVDRFRGPARWPWWMLDTVRTRELPGTPEHIDALAEITLPDHDGQPTRLRDLWRDGPAVIVWLRQFGCPFCRAYAVQLNRARSRFEAAGAHLTFIGQGSPTDAANFRARIGIDLPVLADADRVTYLWAGTKLATLDELIGPLVVGRAVLAMAREHVVLGHNTADEAQLGGSIVVLPDGQIPFAHISKDASDMASPDELIKVLDAAAGRTPAPIAPPRRRWSPGGEPT